MGNTIMLNTAILDGGVIIKRSGGGTPPAPTPNVPVIGDGKTYLYIKIAEKGRMTVPLYFSQTVANGVVIDWGDGSDTKTIGGTGNKSTSHTYAEIGEYVISLNPTNGCVLGLGYKSSSYCVLGGLGKDRVYRNMLQAVEVGIGVTSIDDYAFYQCYSLANVVIPEGVTSIGEYAFGECHDLASVVIPEGVTSIGQGAFYNCYSLASIVIPEGVTSIGKNAFYQCYSLANVVIPKGVTSIGQGAFYKCSSLASVVIPEGVTSIDDSVFRNCSSLASVVIPEGVTSIGEYAFGDCYDLASVVIPKGVTSIGQGAFYNCYSLASIVIPEGVTSIGNYAFRRCHSLANVVIPKGVTSIGNYAFEECEGMAFYDFSQCESVPTLGGGNAFYNIPTDCKIVVPDSLYDSWVAATNWSYQASKIVKASEFNA